MLSLQKKKWIVKQKELGQLTDSQIAMAQGVSRRYVQKLWAIHITTGLKDNPLGRPEVELPFAVKQQIVDLRKEGHGIRRIEVLE